MFPASKQLAHGLVVPLTADSVDAPIVQYGGGRTAINFATREGRWGRVTFEGLDSIKVSRGEYRPFPPAQTEETAHHWVSTVSNSQWLRERYDYEKTYYGSNYNFGGNVDEMLTDFSHYIFRFHDQFVEVLAAGIWFEVDDTMLGNRDPDIDHPLSGLRHITTFEEFMEEGIICRVRRNPLSDDELKERALLCSQTILEIVPVLEGKESHAGWSLTLRTRNGISTSRLRSSLGKVVASFEGVPDLLALRPQVDQWLREVRKRRQKMGKS